MSFPLIQRKRHLPPKVSFSLPLFCFRLLPFQECLGILAARCASCNCMTYFYCAPLQVYTPFRSAQNHCPPDNVRPAGGYISWGIDSQLIHINDLPGMPHRLCIRQIRFLLRYQSLSQDHHSLKLLQRLHHLQMHTYIPR